MAEDSFQEKTEEPTEKRIEQFREEGQVAKSIEISAFFGLLISAFLIFFLMEPLSQNVLRATKGAFHLVAQTQRNNHLLWFSFYAVPVLKIFLVAMVSVFFLMAFTNIMQTGLMFSLKVLTPKFSHINPLSGIKKQFSMQAIVNLAKSLLKIIVILSLLYFDFKANLEGLIKIPSLPLDASFNFIARLIAFLVLKIFIFLAVIALFDFAYQRFSMKKKMMMTKQELKDELKQQQLPDHVKSKVRQVARERSKQTIQKEVPNADVIITNPTHYAVAIRYKRFVDFAPKVVAKGKDHLALHIRKIAKENDVPIYEYPVLARGLYRQVKVKEYVPRDFYEAVAQVLAFVYRLKNKTYQQAS